MKLEDIKATLSRLEPPFPRGTAATAFGWLLDRHGETVAAAVDKMLFGGLDAAEQAALKSLDPGQWEAINANAAEWLLAEGEIQVAGVPRRVADLLLSPDGPSFTATERLWLEQLARQPLRMYAVTAVVTEQQITVRDALDDAAAPFVIASAAASRAVQPGSLIGMRITRAGSPAEVSWALYGFDAQTGAGVVDQLREAVERLGTDGMDLTGISSLLIRLCWLVQHFENLSRQRAARGQGSPSACACGGKGSCGGAG